MSTSPPEAAFAAPADPPPVPPHLPAPPASSDLPAPPASPAPGHFPSPASPETAPLSETPPAPRRKGLALAALIVGIAAFVLGLAPFVGILLGGTAVVLGILALVKRHPKPFAITGLSLGAVGLIASIIASAMFGVVLANFDTILAQAQQAQVDDGESPVAPDEPTPSADAEAPETTAVPPAGVDLAAFTETDAATFGAIAADPDAHLGQQLLVYGEVSQFDDITGPCGLLVGVSNTLQQTWEGYQQPAVGVAGTVAADGTADCPQLAGVANLSHVKLWVTVDGTYPVDFDSGTENLPGFEIHQVEFLPPL